MKISFAKDKFSPIHFLGSFTIDKENRGFILIPKNYIKAEKSLSSFAKIISHVNHSYLIDYRLIPSCSIDISITNPNNKALTINIPIIRTHEEEKILNKISFTTELYGYSENGISSLFNDITTNCKKRKAHIKKDIKSFSKRLINFNEVIGKFDKINQSIDDNQNKILLLKQKKTDYKLIIKNNNQLLDKNKDTMNQLANEIIKENEEKVNLSYYLSILKEKEDNYTSTIEIYAKDMKNLTNQIEKIERDIEIFTQKRKELKKQYDAIETTVPQALLLSQTINELEDIDHIINIKQLRITELNGILTEEYNQLKSIEKKETDSKMKYDNNILPNSLQKEIDDIEKQISALYRLKAEKEKKYQNELNNAQSLAEDYEKVKITKIELEQIILSHNIEKDVLLNDISYETQIKAIQNQPLHQSQPTIINASQSEKEINNNATQIPKINNINIMKETVESYNNTLYLLTKHHQDLMILKNIINEQHMTAQKKLLKITIEKEKTDLQLNKLQQFLFDNENTLKHYQSEFNSIDSFSLCIDEYNEMDNKLNALKEVTDKLIEKRAQLLNTLNSQKYDLFLISKTLNSEVNFSGDMSLFISDRNLHIKDKISTILLLLNKIVV